MLTFATGNSSTMESYTDYDEAIENLYYLTDDNRCDRNHTRKYKKQLRDEFRTLKQEQKGHKEKINELLSNSDWERLEKFLTTILGTDKSFIDKCFDRDGNTLLHLAATNMRNSIFRLLLENGANPCVKNREKLTPYQCAKGKEARRILRRFAQKHPGKYNYNDMGIPGFEEKIEKVRVKRVLRVWAINPPTYVGEMKALDGERVINQRAANFLAFLNDKRMDLVQMYLNDPKGLFTRCEVCGVFAVGSNPFQSGNKKFCSAQCCQMYKNPSFKVRV